MIRRIVIEPSLTLQHSEGSYGIHIEAGALDALGSIVRECVPDASRAVLAVDEAILTTHGQAAAQSMRAAQWEVAAVPLKADERSKSLDAARRLYDAMVAHRMDRTSPLVAVGGGIVGDVAGFAAATFHRGVPLVHVPTTLLAMVDASIGGKTGVNLAFSGGGLGKNLIGAFWQPRAVVSDPRTLASLHDRDFKCGLAECIKHALIGDAALIEWLELNAAAVLAREETVMKVLITRSARLKASIVEQDEHERSVRAHLNLGHTYGHAIESLPELDVRHGEAVAIGLMAAMHAAMVMQIMDEAPAMRVATLLTRLGLPTRLPMKAPLARMMAAMGMDKKQQAGRMRLILPLRGGGVRIVENPPIGAVTAGWKAVGAENGA